VHIARGISEKIVIWTLKSFCRFKPSFCQFKPV